MAVVLMGGAAFAQNQMVKRSGLPDKAAIVAKQKAQKHKDAKPSTMTVREACNRRSLLPFGRDEAKDGCVVSSFPYTEGFESSTLPCWQTVDADGDGFCWTPVLQGAGRNGGGCLSSASYDNDSEEALTPDNWLISPKFQIPASGLPLELSWYAAAQDPDYPADHYSVYISTTDSAVSSFTTAVFSETLTSDVFVRHSVDLSAYAGQQIFVAFRHHNCTDEFMMKIDDVAIKTAGVPEVVVNGPRGGIMGDTMRYTATVTSTSTSAVTCAWNIAGASVSANDTVADAVWSSAGTYTVAVTATNAIGSVTDSIAVTILDCGAITSMPFAEGFEAGFLGCWTSVDVDDDGETWVVSEGMGRNGGYALTSSSYDGEQVQDNWLISQPITIPATGDYELSWYARPYSSGWHEEHYVVYVSTTGNSVSDFTDSIYWETMPAIEDYTCRMVSLSAYAGRTVYLAFRHHCVDQYALLIDDISIAAPSAPGVMIIAPEAATSVQSIVLKADVSSASAVTYSWRIEGATPSTATTDSVVVSWRGAADGTYGIYLTVTNAVGSSSDTAVIDIINCDGHIAEFPYVTTFSNGLGCWSTIDADGDEYCWEADDSIGMYSYALDPLYLMFGYAMPIVTDNYLVTPPIDVPQAGYTMFKVDAASMYADNNYFDSLEIRISTVEPASAASFSTVLKPQTRVVDETHYVSLADYAGQTVYVAVVHKGYGGGILNVKRVEITSNTEGVDAVDGVCNVSLYPNPATSTVTVQGTGLSMVELFDASGRKVMTVSGDGMVTLDVANLPAGVYMVRSVTLNGTEVQKLIIR